MMNTDSFERNYWNQRYREAATGWDIGRPSTPLVAYINQLKDKTLKILIPGAGNAYEAEYLFNNGFKNVFVLDIAKLPLENLQCRVPHFPSNQLIHENLFSHKNTYDLILEQTFFCALEPTQINRDTYAKHMHSLLNAHGKLAGLWFNIPLNKASERPFGGTREMYLNHLTPYFEVQCFEHCYNSIPARKENELFGIFTKK
ncbi:SAM-dependent methyltransferase [Lacinutrix neustonica]|uniref:SAM-dependent methyltransferase n=1 Tax=Lacinutrix neustonica TaxID=2980107 RepID=A0A9E8SFQ9_9FLAO|nr:SAM-dependent methyltransferase [Lacinutrix neustonica]WAC00995.1 SAM-dependent methyltransferase [Lacinutrix neustonica]